MQPFCKYTASTFLFVCDSCPPTCADWILLESGSLVILLRASWKNWQIAVLFWRAALCGTEGSSMIRTLSSVHKKQKALFLPLCAKPHPIALHLHLCLPWNIQNRDPDIYTTDKTFSQQLPLNDIRIWYNSRARLMLNFEVDTNCQVKTIRIYLLILVFWH